MTSPAPPTGEGPGSVPRLEAEEAAADARAALRLRPGWEKPGCELELLNPPEEALRAFTDGLDANPELSDHVRDLRQGLQQAQQRAAGREGQGGASCAADLRRQRYRLVKLLGHGAYGIVVQAEDLENGAMVAIKLLPRGSTFSSSAANKPYMLYVGREILHQASLHHPFIVQVHEVFLTPKHLAIAMEFGDAGSLLAYLQRQPGKRLPEAAARWLFQQVVIGLSYTHQRGVANRDLKLENLLLCSNRADAARPLLKIADFGFSKHDHNSSARTRCGTEAYMAPEVVCCNGRYMAKKSDVWSVGVILYTMLVGGFPWTPGDKDCVQNIIQAKYVIPPGLPISTACLDLLSRMLCADPDQRWSTEQIQEHPWFQQDLPEGARAMNDFYIRSAPSVDHAAPLVAAVLEHAAAPGPPDEQLISCRFSSPPRTVAPPEAA